MTVAPNLSFWVLTGQNIYKCEVICLAIKKHMFKRFIEWNTCLLQRFERFTEWNAQWDAFHYDRMQHERNSSLLFELGSVLKPGTGRQLKFVPKVG